MDRKSKIITTIIIVVFIFFSIIAEFPDEFWQFIGTATNTDYARITDVEYKAVLVDGNDDQTVVNNDYYYDEINHQSKVLVTETITFDIKAASKDNPFWELWLGLGEEEIDGIRRTYKVNSVKEVLSDGTKITWDEAPQLYWDDDDYVDTYRGLGPNKWYHSEGPYNEYARKYECLMFYVDGIYRDKITFEIEYEIYNAVLKYADCSELYIPMYSGETVKYLESFKGEILIADKDMPKYSNYEATGFGTKNGSFDLEKSTSKHKGYTTFSFNLKEKDLKFLKGYEYLEFDMYSKGEDKHIFADYATNNHYSTYDELTEVVTNRNYYLNAPKRHTTTVIIANIFILSIGVVVLLFGFFKVKNAKNKYPALTKEQKNNYIFREIPMDIDPKFATELVFIKDSKLPKNNEDAMYASLLLSLSRKQYVELIDFGNDTTIRLLRPNKMSQSQMPNMSASYYPQSFPNQPYNQYSAPYVQYPSQPNYAYGGQSTIYSQYSTPAYNQTPPAYNVNNQINDIIDDREPLTYCEQQYYNLLLRHIHGDSITIASLERRISMDSKFANEFQNKIKASNINNAGPYSYTTSHLYDSDKTKLKRYGKRFVWLGAGILTIGNLIAIASTIGQPLFACFAIGVAGILLGAYAISQSKHCVSLTPFGEQEYLKWRGLYNFLKSDTLLTERTHIELPLWEKYLVYATAFGISEKVVEAIRIRCITVPPQTSIANTSHYRIRHIHTRSSSIRRSVHTSSHSYRSSSGFGSGYNVGGRGIGGGGGGH